MDGTKIMLTIPPEFDHKINHWIADLKHKGVKKTKAELLIKLAIIGFNTDVKEQ